MNDKVFIASMTVFAVLGLFFVSQGITGMIIFDKYTAPLCINSEMCVAPLVCCPFYQENSGVCYNASMCDQIYALRGGEIPGKGIQINNLVSSILFALGALILIVIGFMLVLFNKQHTTKKHTT